MADERTLGQLFADASRDLSELIRYELALAKAEIRDDVKRGAAAGGLFTGAGLVALGGAITLLITIGLALAALGLPTWAAFGIETLVLFLLAGLLGALGYFQVTKIRPPQRTIRSTQLTIAAVRGGLTGRANGAADDTGGS